MDASAICSAGGAAAATATAAGRDGSVRGGRRGFASAPHGHQDCIDLRDAAERSDDFLITVLGGEEKLKFQVECFVLQLLLTRIGHQDGPKRLQRSQHHEDAHGFHQAFGIELDADMEHAEAGGARFLNGRQLEIAHGHGDRRDRCFHGGRRGGGRRLRHGDGRGRLSEAQGAQPGDKSGNVLVRLGIVAVGAHGVHERHESVQTIQKRVDDARIHAKLVVAQIVEDVLHLMRQIADRHETHGAAGSLQRVGGAEQSLQHLLRMVAALHFQDVRLQQIELLAAFIEKYAEVLGHVQVIHKSSCPKWESTRQIITG